MMRLKTMTLADMHEFQREAVRIETEITIARSPEDVFDYVTTPALWHTWHPATLGVYDVEPRPLTTGETMREKIAVAWRRSEAVWTVLRHDRPGSWEIGTDTGAGSAHIVYRLSAVGTGCRFHRTLDFRSKGWPWRALDASVTRWILERQSARALRNLKTVIEQVIVAQPIQQL